MDQPAAETETPACQPALNAKRNNAMLVVAPEGGCEQVWGIEFSLLEGVFWGHQCDVYWNRGLKDGESIVNHNAEVQ